MIGLERFSELPEYPFARLRALLGDQPPGASPIDLSVGEPTHAFPACVVEAVLEHGSDFGRYPSNSGEAGLLRAASDWIERRYSVSADPDTQFVALNGTREGLFNACLALCPDRKNGRRACVLIPNPFYQVYAAAALAAGAEPVYVSAAEETGFLPEFERVPKEILDRTAVAFICSPSNPQGAVASRAYFEKLVGLARKHDFKVFSDECYSEIYRREPPAGALQAAGADVETVVVFHSLSKRSNLPGLRSGFICSGPEAIGRFKWLRGYNGASLPIPLQMAAERAWREESHVAESRERYRRKYALVDEIFAEAEGCSTPEAGFFLWLPVADGEATALQLWQEDGVRVLPGSYLAREVDGVNPGQDRIRVALCAPEDQLRSGLEKVRKTLVH